MQNQLHHLLHSANNLLVVKVLTIIFAFLIGFGLWCRTWLVSRGMSDDMGLVLHGMGIGALILLGLFAMFMVLCLITDEPGLESLSDGLIRITSFVAGYAAWLSLLGFVFQSWELFSGWLHAVK